MEASPDKSSATDKKPAKRAYTMERFKQDGREWFSRHNGVACVAIAIAFCAALFGLFLFVAFSDFGGSADFIYNQF